MEEVFKGKPKQHLISYGLLDKRLITSMLCFEFRRNKT